MPWSTKKLGEILEYEQPMKYLVSSTEYKVEYPTPVLTAGKTFILGNTNEKKGIFPKEKLPVIIFDDFTTASKFVNFPFKVKSSAMKILHPRKDLVDAKFVFYKMQTIDFPATQHKRYWISKYSKIEILLPPLTEQKRIVAKIQKLFAKIDEAERLRAEALSASAALLPSALHQIFSRAEKEGWNEIEIGRVASVQSGFGFPKDLQGKASGDFPFFKVSDMNSQGNEEEMKIANHWITKDDAKRKGYKITPKETIIFPKIGGAISTNKKRKLVQDSIYDNNVMGLIPNEKILSDFLFWWLKGFDITAWASDSALPSMKKTTIEETIIPLPPIAEQKKIVAYLDSLSEKTRQLRELQQQTANDLSALKQSILHQAFVQKF